MELGGVPKGGLNITLKPKNPSQGLGDASERSYKYPFKTRVVAISVATL